MQVCWQQPWQSSQVCRTGLHSLPGCQVGRRVRRCTGEAGCWGLPSEEADPLVLGPPRLCRCSARSATAMASLVPNFAERMSRPSCNSAVTAMLSKGADPEQEPAAVQLLAQADVGLSRPRIASFAGACCTCAMLCKASLQCLQEMHAEADLAGLRTRPPGSHRHHQLLGILGSAQAGLNLCTALRASFERLYSSRTTVTGLGSAPCTP